MSSLGVADNGELIGRLANLMRFPLVWSCSHWCGFSLGARRFKLGDFALMLKIMRSAHIHIWLFWSTFWKNSNVMSVASLMKQMVISFWVGQSTKMKKFKITICGYSVKNIQQGERLCNGAREPRNYFLKMWVLLYFAGVNALFWLTIEALSYRLKYPEMFRLNR